MRAIIAENPGVGIGSEWIDDVVDEIAQLELDPFCGSPSPEFYLELKALLILGAKDGGGRGFWILDEKPSLFALALCHHSIHWRDGMKELRAKANSFICSMRKEAPLWMETPLFEPATYPIQAASDLGITSIFAALPLLARIHLLMFSQRGAGALMQATNYNMRNLGVNPKETAPILLSCGLCEATSDLSALNSVFSKESLIAELTRRSITFRKSWKKEQLLSALAVGAPEIIDEVARQEKAARIKTEFLAPLQSLANHAASLNEGFKLLCFAGKNAT